MLLAVQERTGKEKRDVIYSKPFDTLQSAFSDSFEMQFVFYLLQIMNTNKNTQQVE